MYARQGTNLPVAEWDLAQLTEHQSASSTHQKVSQLVLTDIVTVQPDDPIALVAELMTWERARCVPVEDDQGRMVGLVTQGRVLRYLARCHGRQRLVVNAAAGTVVTSARDAAALMKQHRIGALPVMQGDHVVALLTQEEFVGFAARVLDDAAAATLPPTPAEERRARRGCRR